MGFKMDNLHAPTVGSGSASNGNGDDVRSFQELITRKENLEAELSALGSVLDSHGVNMNTSLLTFDGFPRADIDVAQIRTTRARIIQLKNDHKAAMKQLEEAVHKQFATGKAIDGVARDDAPRTTNGTTSAPPVAAPTTIAHQPPFARINTVSPGGPAEQAGLQAEDRLVVFGSVNFTNHERLGKVAQVVQQNENRPILVKVLRQAADQTASQLVELRLTPQRDWGGRGLLGCHLLPL